MKLIERLEEYRLENRITQQELAKKLGISFCTVNRWFNGKIKKPNKIQKYHIEKLLLNKNPRKFLKKLKNRKIIV